MIHWSKLFFEDNIRIRNVDALPELDMLLVILNTGSVLQEQL